MFTYLHFGHGDNSFPPKPRLTVKVPAKESKINPRRLPITGYGTKIPSNYMVQWGGRWRRVYIACHSNIGTAYIGRPGDWLATVGEIEV